MEARNMDWHSSPLEPNLKYVSELKEDLKTIYFEQYAEAKIALEDFSRSLQNVYFKHQQLLIKSIELSVSNVKLKKFVDSQENKNNVATIIEQPSQILGASPNCKLRIASKHSLNNTENNLDDKPSSVAQKENINDIPPIYSEDFDSDVEDASFIRNKSPLASVANSPVKLLSSPILSKRKKSSSKKSSSSANTSTQSIDSNNDSKVSFANASSFDRNINIDPDLSKEFEKEYFNEPLKPIENILQSPSQHKQDKNVPFKILSVSKTNYTKTSISDLGKKSRQTTLNFKKETPVIDISKVNFDESFGNTSKSIVKRENSWSESFSTKSITNCNSNSILANMKKYNSPKYGSKNYKTLNNQSALAKEIECIEISPTQNGKSSKLRRKFSFIKKSNISNVKEESSKVPDPKTSFPTSDLQPKSSSKNSKITAEKSQYNSSLAANLPMRSLSDETYFSPAELTNYKSDTTNIDIDFSEFEDDDVQQGTPPAKKILLDSFDMIPGREEKVPAYAYKEGPVRKKSEKEKLPGWGCRDCEEYYKDLTEEERKTRLNKCSRHRGRYPPQHDATNDSFWYPHMDDDPIYGDTSD